MSLISWFSWRCVDIRITFHGPPYTNMRTISRSGPTSRVVGKLIVHENHEMHEIWPSRSDITCYPTQISTGKHTRNVHKILTSRARACPLPGVGNRHPDGFPAWRRKTTTSRIAGNVFCREPWFGKAVNWLRRTARSSINPREARDKPLPYRRDF